MKNTLAKFELPEAEEHFSQLTKAQKEHEQPNKSFEEFISVLDVVIHENCLKLTFMPHSVNIPANLKIELIEISEDNIMKYLFNSKNDPHEIWKNAIDYPRLRHHAQKMLSCFPTTYCCEQLSHI